MAISIVDKQLTITCGYMSDYEDAYDRLTALIDILRFVNQDTISPNLMCIMANMMEELLPTREEFIFMGKLKNIE